MNMMPMQPFWLDLIAIALAFAGFAALALASEREGKLLLHRLPASKERLRFRLTGWLLLLASLAVGIAGWYVNYGVFLWFGWLTIAATALVFLLPYWPWRRKEQDRRRRRDAPEGGNGSPAISRGRAAGQAALILGLVALPAGLVSALGEAPVHPLLRDDAISGRVGPWTFRMAEEERAPPVEIGDGVRAKHVMLRFCAACDGQIREAYLKVRRPRLPLAVGNGFHGERGARETTLVIPPAAEVADGIWLTVVGKDGAVHQAEIDWARLSPATARFIQGQKR